MKRHFISFNPKNIKPGQAFNRRIIRCLRLVLASEKVFNICHYALENHISKRQAERDVCDLRRAGVDIEARKGTGTFRIFGNSL
jgi:predicted DNA-binding transcriptional regulator YafY